MLLDSDRNRIQHMLEAGLQAISFMQDRNREHLDTDTQLRFALLRAIEVLGEAASRVSPELRETKPEIPWQQIVSTRNRLIHAYFDIDTDIVWTTVTESIPNLVPMLESILESKK